MRRQKSAGGTGNAAIRRKEPTLPNSFGPRGRGGSAQDGEKRRRKSGALAGASGWKRPALGGCGDQRSLRPVHAQFTWPALPPVVQKKLEEYMRNGARLGWLLDPLAKPLKSAPGRLACLFLGPV